MSELEILTAEEIDRARFLASCQEPTFKGQGYSINRLCEEIAKIVVAKTSKAKDEEIEATKVAFTKLIKDMRDEYENSAIPTRIATERKQCKAFTI